MLTLRNVLKTNAVSSGITGVCLVALSEFVASLFEVTHTTPFIAVGLFLLVFASVVMYTALQTNIPTQWVRAIIGLDVSWVLGSMVAIVGLADAVSVLGIALIAGIAAWVAVMAVLQRTCLRAGNKTATP